MAAKVEPVEAVPVWKATILMGNVDAKGAERVKDDSEPGGYRLEYVHVPGNRITRIGIRAQDLAGAFADVTATRGVWAYHSWAPPAWVEGDHEGLVQMLASLYGCPVGRPKGWDKEAT